MFELPKGEPTFNYGFTQAVEEGFLVDYVNFDSTPTLLKTGLKYDDLSDDEKEHYEEVFADESGNFPKEIDKKMFYKQIMNTGTIDAIIQTLMNEGLKIQSGEKLGKSIIFAYNHDHAKAIVDRFNILYPELGGQGFCKLVDYSVNYVSIIKKPAMRRNTNRLERKILRWANRPPLSRSSTKKDRKSFQKVVRCTRSCTPDY